MEMRPENMSPEELAAFVQRCAVLRSSAQTRKSALTQEATKLGATRKKAVKKDSVSMALDMLRQIQTKGVAQ